MLTWIGRNGDTLTVDTYVDGSTLTIHDPVDGWVTSVELTNRQTAELRTALAHWADGAYPQATTDGDAS